MQKENVNVGNKKRLLSPSVSVGDLPIFVSTGTVNKRKDSGRCRTENFRHDKFFCMNDNGGFTLIELLVVVLIIGILAAVAVPQYQMAVMRSRYAALKSNVKALDEAEKIYHLANGQYTENFEELSLDLTGCVVSSNKKSCGQCTLSKNPGRISCVDTTTLKNGYVRYFSSKVYGDASCWAFTTDKTDKYNKLCQKEGGVFLESGVCPGGACNVYKLTK